MTKQPTGGALMARATPADIERSSAVTRAAQRLQYSWWTPAKAAPSIDSISDIPREWRLFFGRCVQLIVDNGSYNRINDGYLSLLSATDPDKEYLALHPSLRESLSLSSLVPVYESALQEANQKISQLYDIIFQEIPGLSPSLKGAPDLSAEYENELRSELRELLNEHMVSALAVDESATDLPESFWLKQTWPAEVSVVFSAVPGADALSEHHKHRLNSHINRMLLERMPTASIINAATSLIKGME